MHLEKRSADRRASEFGDAFEGLLSREYGGKAVDAFSTDENITRTIRLAPRF